MRVPRHVSGLISALRGFSRHIAAAPPSADPAPPPKIGLALGGGFARGIAHAGVLEVFQRHRIPIHCITGVSAGSIVAAAYASGASPAEIAHSGCAMRFGDVARWSLGRMGFVVSERMKRFLERLLKRYRFEEMQIPLGVLATDLSSGEAVTFHGSGDVFLPIRASCSYPGLFQPVRWDGRLLVDGAIAMEIPALLARQLGATFVISVHLPAQAGNRPPRNVFQVVNRSFQILQTCTEDGWRRHSDLVITPGVSEIEWDGFGFGAEMLKAGEAAALAALPLIPVGPVARPLGPHVPVDPAGCPAVTPGSIPA
ncbi:MAG TPA: patatin-like phospholipase family protein [Bryobacteraceae bacterium]|nr:patatin-like phospholipase family protein [Bryobacteraceae bacterium]